MISPPTYIREGLWGVETDIGMKVFPDEETAYDFYLLNKHVEEQKQLNNGKKSDS